jgi:hypothetical protein
MDWRFELVPAGTVLDYAEQTESERLVCAQGISMTDNSLREYHYSACALTHRQQEAPAKGLLFMRFGRVVLVLALCLVLAPSLRAQQVEAELDRTDIIIEKAADMAREAGNVQAGELVNRAVEIQLQARAAFGRGLLVLAEARTRMARGLAERAIALLMRPEERIERVELELQRTDELLAQARDELRDTQSEAALTILDLAERQQQQAWQLFRSNRLRPALRLTQNVREMIARASSQNEGVDPESLLLELEATGEIVRQASDAAEESGERRWIELARRAAEMLANAQRHAEEHRLRAAWQIMEQARKIAGQVLAQADDSESTRNDFERARVHYEELSQRLRERLAEQPNDEAIELLAQSQVHFDLALEIAAGNPDEHWRAMAEMRIALRLLTQAANLMK